MRALRKWMLLLALAFAPLPAAGQPCGGFIDVVPGDFFCVDAEWIRNRGVTIGCVEVPLQYCPDNFVLRGEMAAFLRRLGDALQPDILRTTDPAFNGTYNPSAVGCVSAAFPIIPAPPLKEYPRQASFAAVLMNYNASATKTIQGRLVFSTDGGTNWNPTPGDFVMWQTVDPGERTTLALVGGPLNLNVGSTYHFAIETQTNDPGATVSGQCQLNVRIESRTGASTPF
jgi:hypothetical protein